MNQVRRRVNGITHWVLSGCWGRPSPLLPLRGLRQVEGRPGALCRRPCPGTSTIPALLQLEYTALLPSRPSRTTPTLFSHPSHPKFRFYSAPKRRRTDLKPLFLVSYPLVPLYALSLRPATHSIPCSHTDTHTTKPCETPTPS